MSENSKKDIGSDAARSDPETADKDRAELKKKAEEAVEARKESDLSDGR